MYTADYIEFNRGSHQTDDGYISVSFQPVVPEQVNIINVAASRYAAAVMNGLPKEERVQILFQHPIVLDRKGYGYGVRRGMFYDPRNDGCISP